MGYGIRPYAVSLARLRKACGSGDEALLARTLRERADDILENDEWFEDEIEDGAPPLALALRRLLEGSAPRRRHAFQYVNALELLCRQIGRPMAGPPLDRTTIDFLDAIDAALAHAGVTALCTDDLVAGEPPVALPCASDAGVSTLERPRVKRALVELSRVRPGSVPPDLADAFEQMTEWMRIASEERGAGIVSFFD